MTKPLIIIQILNFNGLLLENNIFEKSIKSVLDQTYRNYVLHILDNNSTDNSIQYISKKFPGIKITKLKKNYGYTAHNKGLDYFKFIGGKYLFIMNNDIILEKDTIEKMIDFMENNPEIGISSPLIKFYKKQDYINSSGIILNYSAFSKNANYMEYEKNKIEKNITAISGACMCVRDSVIQKTALFDTMYSSYYEDADLSLRVLTETDYKIKINVDTCVYHLSSGTWNKFSNKKDYLILRNQYLIISKLYSIDLLFLNFFFFLKTRFLKRNILFIKIFIFFIFHFPEIILKRFIHIIKSKRNIKKFLHKSFKPFCKEEVLNDYMKISNNTINDEIVFGVNDNILPKGFSILDYNYPIGRYIMDNIQLKIKNLNKKYIKVHGYGDGELEINNKKYSIKGLFSIYIENSFNNDIILNMQAEDKVKLIKIEQCDEKV